MTTQKRPETKLPTKMDVEKAEIVLRKIVEENKEWLKEMAKR